MVKVAMAEVVTVPPPAPVDPKRHGERFGKAETHAMNTHTTASFTATRCLFRRVKRSRSPVRHEDERLSLRAHFSGCGFHSCQSGVLRFGTLTVY